MFDTNTRFNPQAKLAANPKFSQFVAGEKVTPINVEISPTHVCQAKCSWCFYSGTHQKLTADSILEFDLGIKLLSDIKAAGTAAVTWTGGGEPTLHPKFVELSNEASRLGLKQGLFTNALAPIKYQPQLFEWIRVSNTDKAWPIENMKQIRAWVKTMGVAFNYAGDDGGAKKAAEVGRQVGVNYVQIRQALNLRGLVTTRQPPVIPDALVFVTNYKFNDSPNPHGYQRCYGFNFVPFIWHNGDVDVCGYHPGKGAPFTLGNLKDKSYQEIMAQAPRSVQVVPSCQTCCKNHEINKLINQTVDLQDAEFV